MCRSMKLSMLFVLLIVALTACAPAATPVPPTATNPPPTDTPVPPTATSTLAPTNLPAATAAPTERPPYKQLPLPTPTIYDKVDVNGNKMWVECYGKGSPTIILEHGYRTYAASWYSIIPQLAAETQVCTYDRINSGNSIYLYDQPRTMAKSADELNSLMKTLKIDGPYIMAGHSIGGLFVLTYASHYPTNVAGVVLVDSAYLDECKNILKSMPTPAPNENQYITDWRDGCQKDDWKLEEIDMEPEVRAVKSLGAIPLVVLVRNVGNVYAQETYAGAPADLVAILEQVWKDGQKEYTKLSSDSTFLVAKQSGHDIQNDEPELVMDAILGLVDKARQK